MTPLLAKAKIQLRNLATTKRSDLLTTDKFWAKPPASSSDIVEGDIQM